MSGGTGPPPDHRDVLPILLSIPHGGTAIPPEVRERVCLSEQDLFDDGDAFTQEIYDVGRSVVAVVKADVARAFVDLNRAPDDLPPANPDGVVKSHTCCGRSVYCPGRAPDGELIRELLKRYYHPYHDRLSDVATDLGIRLALDCHSMAATAPEIAPDPGQRRPLFCLSNDDGRTCPPAIIDELAAAIRRYFECEPADVWINRPFKGGYITRTHGGGRLPWLQVEMNRSLYLDSQWFTRATLQVMPGRLRDLRKRFAKTLLELSLTTT
jgi:formiminoglutamase